MTLSERPMAHPGGALAVLCAAQGLVRTLAPALTHSAPPLDVVEMLVWGRVGRGRHLQASQPARTASGSRPAPLLRRILARLRSRPGLRGCKLHRRLSARPRSAGAGPPGSQTNREHCYPCNRSIVLPIYPVAQPLSFLLTQIADHGVFLLMALAAGCSAGARPGCCAHMRARPARCPGSLPGRSGKRAWLH